MAGSTSAASCRRCSRGPPSQRRRAAEGRLDRPRPSPGRRARLPAAADPGLRTAPNVWSRGERMRESPDRRRPPGPVPERVIRSTGLCLGWTGPKKIGGSQPLPRCPARSAPAASALGFLSQSQRLATVTPQAPGAGAHLRPLARYARAAARSLCKASAALLTRQPRSPWTRTARMKSSHEAQRGPTRQT